MGIAVTFDEYARLRLRALLRTATAVTGDAHLGEEIVQDVLVKVSRRWAEIGSLEQRDAYIRRMIVNEFISWRRKWARLVPTSRVEPDRQEPDPAERSADHDLLRRELSRIPRKQQIVLSLRYFDALSDVEIAAAIGCRESTVRSFAARGLAALRVQMTVSTSSTSTPTATNRTIEELG